MANWNITPEIPGDAWDLHNGYRPTYPTVDGTDLAGRSGDLGNRIENNQGSLVDLGTSNTYEITNPVSISGSGVWGVTGTDWRIYYVGRNNEYLFRGSGPDGVIEGGTFDITENPATGSTDVGVINYTTAGSFWAKDVSLVGQRHRYQDGSTRGGRYTWKVQGSNTGATVYNENVDITDGDRTVTGTPNGFHDHAQGFTQEWDNEGLIVFWQCASAGWNDNAFYMSTGAGDFGSYSNLPGRAYLIDCFAADSRGGQFRIGQNDALVGGNVEMFNPPTHWTGPGQAITVDHGSPRKIVGTYCEGDTYGAEFLVTRNNAIDVEFDRVVLHASGDTRAVGLRGDAQVDLRDCYWYADWPGSHALAQISRADVNATDFAILSENSIELWVGNSSSFRHDGVDYGDGALSRTQIGAADPRPLPEPYFDFSTTTGPGEFDRYFTVKDATTDEPIDAADVYVYR